MFVIELKLFINALEHIFLNFVQIDNARQDDVKICFKIAVQVRIESVAAPRLTIPEIELVKNGKIFLFNFRQKIPAVNFVLQVQLSKIKRWIFQLLSDVGKGQRFRRKVFMQRSEHLSKKNPLG